MEQSQPSLGKLQFLLGMARGIAFFFATFTLLNLVGESLHSGFDATLWWIDPSPLPATFATVLLSLTTFMLFYFSVRGCFESQVARCVFVSSLLSLALVTIRDAAVFYQLLADSRLHSSFPAAFSLFISFSLVIVLWGERIGESRCGCVCVCVCVCVWVGG